MDDEEIEQTCPFCGAVWETCSHYEMMVGLEAEADELGNVIEEPQQETDES